jgi:hypothetical protein
MVLNNIDQPLLPSSIEKAGNYQLVAGFPCVHMIVIWVRFFDNF